MLIRPHEVGKSRKVRQEPKPAPHSWRKRAPQIRQPVWAAVAWAITQGIWWPSSALSGSDQCL